MHDIPHANERTVGEIEGFKSVAWLGAAVSPNTAPARPYYLRAPDAKPAKDPQQNTSQPTAS